MNLLVVEVRRCLARRLVWVLVGVALVAIVAVGLLVFVAAGRESNRPGQSQQSCRVVQARPDASAELVCSDGPPEEPGGFELVGLWPKDGGAPMLAVTVVFLGIGGLLGGASMIGAEWRAGTMGTVLTWEPRRVRLAVAKLAALTGLAWLIAMALQVLLVLALVPAAAAHGSTAGADAEWLGLLAGGIFRSGAMAAMAALVGGSIAMIGRNTAAAFGAAFVYLMIGENVVRAWKPWLRPWLLGENGVIFLTGRRLPDPLVGRGFGTAALTLVAYSVGFAAVAVASLRLRDVASN